MHIFEGSLGVNRCRGIFWCCNAGVRNPRLCETHGRGRGLWRLRRLCGFEECWQRCFFSWETCHFCILEDDVRSLRCSIWCFRGDQKARFEAVTTLEIRAHLCEIWFWYHFQWVLAVCDRINSSLFVFIQWNWKRHGSRCRKRCKCRCFLLQGCKKYHEYADRLHFCSKKPRYLQCDWTTRWENRVNKNCFCHMVHLKKHSVRMMYIVQVICFLHKRHHHLPWHCQQAKPNNKLVLKYITISCRLERRKWRSDWKSGNLFPKIVAPWTNQAAIFHCNTFAAKQ